MIFSSDELKNLKVRRFLKCRVELSEEDKKVIFGKLEAAYESQDNMRIEFFINGVTEYEYSKIKKINHRRGIVKLKNGTKINIGDIVDLKEQ